MMRLVWFVRLALVISLQSLAACHNGGAQPPVGWQGHAIDLADHADPVDHGRLQVFCCYGPMLPNHTALRLVAPDKPTIFWDPGGGYATDENIIRRRNDLVIVDPPDLPTYTQYRMAKVKDASTEVFEWDINPRLAAQWHEVLNSGTDKSHPNGKFSTQSVGMACCLSVSGFLQQFGGQKILVPKKYFLPQDLAAILKTQRPDRVIILRRDEPVLVYVPPLPPGEGD